MGHLRNRHGSAVRGPCSSFPDNKSQASPGWLYVYVAIRTDSCRSFVRSVTLRGRKSTARGVVGAKVALREASNRSEYRENSPRPPALLKPLRGMLYYSFIAVTVFFAHLVSVHIQRGTADTNLHTLLASSRQPSDPSRSFLRKLTNLVLASARPLDLVQDPLAIHEIF